MGIDIGYNIKSARNAAGLTQEELARQCGVATITIRQYESGKREPKYDTLERLADALDVPLEVLLGIGDSISSAGTTGTEGLEQLPKDTQEGKTDFPYPDMTGRTERYEPWTQADEMILRAGGFRAVAEFNFLSDVDKAEALKDINKFIEFTLSKYKQLDRAETAPQSPPAPQGDDTDTTPPSPPPESAENAE